MNKKPTIEPQATIYGIRGKDDSLYFYVGSTKYTAEYRFQQHLEQIKGRFNKNRHFVNKAFKVGLDNLVVDTLIKCEPSKQFEIEHEWIECLKALGHPLTNMVYNGEYVKKAEKNSDIDVLLWSFKNLFEHRIDNPTQKSAEIAKWFLTWIDDPVVYGNLICG